MITTGVPYSVTNVLLKCVPFSGADSTFDDTSHDMKRRYIPLSHALSIAGFNKIHSDQQKSRNMDRDTYVHW